MIFLPPPFSLVSFKSFAILIDYILLFMLKSKAQIFVNLFSDSHNIPRKQSGLTWGTHLRTYIVELAYECLKLTLF